MHINSDYLEILADNKWEHPKDYFGFSPDGDYLIASKHRESSILEKSNYEVADKILRDAVRNESIEYNGNEKDGQGYIVRPDWVYDWRAGHSMIGWIDYLMVRKDAPESILIAAAEIVCSLSDYPVLSDDDYSAMRYQAVEDYWEDAVLPERIDICKDAKESIFAARDKYPRRSILDSLLDSEIAK